MDTVFYKRNFHAEITEKIHVIYPAAVNEPDVDASRRVIAIAVDGAGLIHVKYGAIPLHKGNAIVIPPEGVQSFRDIGSLQLILISFPSPSSLIPPLDLVCMQGFHALFSLEASFFSAHTPYPLIRLNGAQLRGIFETVNAFQRNYTIEAAGREAGSVSLLLNLMLLLSGIYWSESSKDPACVIGKLVSYLHKEYQREIALHDLQEISGLSRSKLLRGFRSALGVSPIDYLLDIRISHALRTLRCSNGSIKKIGEYCGFSDGNYFSRIFKQRVGVSPGEYQKFFQAIRCFREEF